MPLIAQLFKEGDEQHAREKTEHEHGNNESRSIEKENITEQKGDFYELQAYDNPDDFDEDDEDMLTRPRPKKLVPELPKKSHLRTSKILDSLTLDLQNLGRRKIEDEDSLDSNPLDSYLSSEEDGSASGDDYEDVMSDEEDGDESAPARRHSYEETAKAVSFVCLKPQIIEISHHHHQSPASYAMDTLNERSQSVTSSRSQPLLATLPKRTSSRPPLSVDTFNAPSTNPTSTHSASSVSSATATTQPSFLSSDPYPHESQTSSMLSPTSTYSRTNTPSPQNGRAEKTSSGWGSLKAMSRTLALARKKASMPKMNLAYTNGVVQSKRNSISPVQNSTPISAASSSTSISSTENTSAPAPGIPPRRRSQTFDRLMRVSSREEKRGSDYSGRYASEDWRVMLASTNTHHRRESSISMSTRTKTTYITRPRTSGEHAHSPVDAIIASIPSIDRHKRSDSTEITEIPPTLGRRGRSYTTSQASGLSRQDSTRSSSRRKDSSSIPRTVNTNHTSTKNHDILTTPFTSTPPTSYFTPPPPPIPSIPVEKQSRRLTTFPDYSRAGRVARDRAEQKRDSGVAENVISPGTAPVGNTYHDIMRSVALNGGVMKEGKTVRGRSSMAVLAAGLRRSGRT